MKYAFFLLALFLPASAFAIPGSISIVCHSPEGARDIVKLKFNKFEVNTDDFPSAVNLEINGIAFRATEDDSVAAALHVIKHVKDKVIAVSFDKNVEGGTSHFQFWAKPKTLKKISGSDLGNSKYSMRAGFSGEVTKGEEHKYSDIELNCQMSLFYGS